MKAKIAAVSPFLLITRDPRDFPHESSEKDIPFSTFRTIDAADLLRVHNAVAQNRLGQDVSTFWDKLRQQRNIVMHLGWIKAPPISALELVSHILYVNRFLNPDMTWPRVLLDGYNEPDLSFPYSDKESIAYGTTVEQIKLTIDELPPSLVKRYFGYNTKNRSYDCPHCYSEASNSHSDFSPLAQLRPRSPTSTTLYCFVCDQTTPVLRRHCQAEGCPSNVLSDDEGSWGQCLVCGHDNSPDEIGKAP